jgi:hypothetical protein
VRISLERPDSITASAVTAREEIGRAVAARIREVQDARELKKVAEDVLPQIEKFLESPEEKKMRRIRAGVVVAAAGLGGTVFMALMSAFAHGPDSETFMGVAGLGVACFLIGIGLIINALFFTKLRSRVEDHSLDARAQSLIDAGYTPPASTFKAQTTSNLAMAPGASVTEQTTKHLKTER